MYILRLSLREKKLRQKEIKRSESNIMIKTILTLTAVAISIVGLSQSKFEIRQIGSTYSAEQIQHAFEKANFCGSYYLDNRNVLKMSDGAIVELKSAKEIHSEKMILEESCVLPEGAIYYECIWSIAENGMLLKGFQTEKYKSEKEYKHVNHEN